MSQVESEATDVAATSAGVGNGTSLLVVDSLQGQLDAGGMVAAPDAQPTPALSAAQVRDNLLEWERLFTAARAEATVLAVRADWQVYLGWCEDQDRRPLPTSTEQLVAFLQHQVNAGRKRSTLSRYVYTVREIHKAAGLGDPAAASTWKLQWGGLLRQVAKAGRSAPRQAAPLRGPEIAAILETLGDSKRDLRDAALLLLASDTLCRESELAVVELSHLERQGPDWTLRLGKTKTDQDGMGQYRFVSAEAKAAIDAWCAAAGITEGCIFLPVGGRPKKREPGQETPPPPHLRPKEIATIFRRRAAAAGLPDASRISGHSTRVGSAIELIEDGASVIDTQFAGGWQSERMVLKYSKKARAGTNAMAKLRRSRKTGRK
jgi:integrase